MTHACQLHSFEHIPLIIIDGAMRRGGSWAWMCEKCHIEHGVGLGTGKGQKYFQHRGQVRPIAEMSTVLNQLHDTVGAKLQMLLHNATLRGFDRFFEVKIEYTWGTKAAGAARPLDRVIQLNEGLLLSDTNEQIDGTLPHELAHLIHARMFFQDFKRAPHGGLWQLIMIDWFGVEPNRLHHMATAHVGKGKAAPLDLENLFEEAARAKAEKETKRGS